MMRFGPGVCEKHGINHGVRTCEDYQKDVSAICTSFMTGLDEGPWLPGRAPRKRPKPKCSDELRAIRNKAWKTRRQKLGPKGHR